MILEILILVLAVPTGFMIARLASDELVAGRKYFMILVVFSAIGVIWTWFAGQNPVALSLGFLLIITLVGLIKGRDKSWTKRRFK